MMNLSVSRPSFFIIFFILYFQSLFVLAENSEDFPDCNSELYPYEWNECVGEVNTGTEYSRGTYINGSLTGACDLFYYEPEPTWSYEGECKDGLRHGHGLLIGLGVNEDFSYLGDFVKGVPHGKGTATFANGEDYFGDFANGLRHGQGLYTLSEGNWWFGDWYNGVAMNPGLADATGHPNMFDADLVIQNEEAFIWPTERHIRDKFSKISPPNDKILLSIGPDVDWLSSENIETGEMRFSQLDARVQDAQTSWKKTRIKNLLLACMSYGDQDCFAKYYDKHASLILSGDEGFDKGWSVDLASLFISYRNFIGGNSPKSLDFSWRVGEDPIAKLTDCAALRASIEARIALLSGSWEDGDRLQKIALGLISDFTSCSEPALINVFENAVFLQQNPAVLKRFLKNCTFDNKADRSALNAVEDRYWLCNGMFIDDILYSRLIYMAVFSGALSSLDRLQAVEQLHEIYQDSDIPDRSIVASQKEMFYKYLWIESNFSGSNEFSFRPEDFGGETTSTEVGRKNDQNYQVNVALTAKVIDEDPLPQINHANILDNANSYSHLFVFQPKTRFPVFVFKKSGIDQVTANEIESYLDNFFRQDISIDLVDDLEKKVIENCLYRLFLIGGNSVEAIRTAYYLIADETKKKNPTLSRMFDMLVQADNAFDIEQILSYSLLEANYLYQQSNRFYMSPYARFSSIVDESQSGGWSEVDSQRYEPYLRYLLEAKKTIKDFGQLQKKRTYKLPMVLSDKWYDSSNTFVFAAVTENFYISITVRGDSKKIFISPRANSPVYEKLLRSQDMLDVAPSELDAASSIFTRNIFGANPELSGQIVFLSGPTIGGIPITLLKNIQQNSWLLSSSVLRSFYSFNHYVFVKKASEYQSRRPLSFVSFSNPIIRTDKERESVARVLNMIRGGADRVSILPELPETQLESEKISEALTGVKKTYVRGEANIDNLFSIDFDDVSVLNFSTHGVIAGEFNNAPTSALVLSSTEKHSGLLTLPQLRHIKGAPEMVFLSACKTGVGNINLDRSEITSIAETFLMKGVSGILSSYWSVDSDSSVVLVAEIASNLSKGHEMSLALHLAAKSVMQNDKFFHPAKWAAYVPVGIYQMEDSSYKAVDEREVLLDFSGMERTQVVSGQLGTGYVGFFNPLEKRNQLFTIANNSVVKEVEDKIFESKFNHLYTRFSKRSAWGSLAAFSAEGRSGIFKLDSSGAFEFVCVIDRHPGYILADLSLAANNIILLHKKYDENHSGGKFIVESIGLPNCARIKTRYFHSLAGLDAPRIRIIGKNDFIFVTGSDINKAGIYDSESQKDVLGFASRCIGIVSKSEFEVIDNELNLISRGVLDMQLSNDARLVDDFFIAIRMDGCKYNSQAHAVDRKVMFDDAHSGLTDVVGAGDFEEGSIMEEINEKFLLVQEVWMTSGSPSSRVYVKGIQNSRLSMAGVEVRHFISDDTYDVFQHRYMNMFVSSPTHVGDNKTEYIWTQIESNADCDLDFEPISYGGDVIYRCGEEIKRYHVR